METLGMTTGLYGTRRLHDTAQFDRHVLSNGIVVWLQKPTIMLDYRGYLSVVFAGVGSNADPRGLEGLAHFVEHMVFRGSEKKRLKDALVGPIVEKGGDYQGITNWYCTEYSIELHKDEFPFACETLFEILSQPLFDPAHVESERNPIMQEIRKETVAGEFLMGRHAMKVLFGKGHQSLRNTAGFLSSVAKISVNDLRNFFLQYYHAGNAQIVCGGSFSFRSDVVEILEEIFGKMRCAGKNSAPIRPIVASGGKIILLRDKRYKMDAMDICFFLPQLSLKDRMAVDFLMSMGNNADSRLFSELRTKRGLVYSFSSSIRAMPEGLLAGFHTVVESKNFIEVEKIFFDVMKSTELQAILMSMRKDQLGRLNKFNNPIRACSNAWQELLNFGRTYSVYEEDAVYDDLTLEDVLYWRDQLLVMEPLMSQGNDNVLVAGSRNVRPIGLEY